MLGIGRPRRCTVVHARPHNAYTCVHARTFPRCGASFLLDALAHLFIYLLVYSHITTLNMFTSLVVMNIIIHISTCIINGDDDDSTCSTAALAKQSQRLSMSKQPIGSSLNAPLCWT